MSRFESAFAPRASANAAGMLAAPALATIAGQVDAISYLALHARYWPT